MTHALSTTGFALVKKFEGFRAEPTELPQGGWVIGYGHVRLSAAGEALSKNEAAELLALDLAPFVRLVNAAVTTPIKQSQFDALVSFALSVGEPSFAQSQVLRRVNAGEFVAAACALDAWRSAEIDGVLETAPALVRRRAAEKALFLKDLPLEHAPSALMRAKLDHAASILGAPTKRAPAPVLPVAAPALTPAQRLTEILCAEPATEALLLTQVITEEAEAESELATAHAAPVARKATIAPPFALLKAAKFDLSLAAENFGLFALMAFGIALISIGASILFGGRGDGVNLLAGSAVLAPGLAASSMAGFGLWRSPRPQTARI